MSRVIKFRAWNKQLKEMEDRFWIHSVDLYEGDMFGKLDGDRDRPGEYEVWGTVTYDSDEAAFCVQQTNGGWSYLADYLRKPGFVEVIGNIHSNPELLEETT